MTDEQDLQIEIAPAAQKTIAAMHDRVRAIGLEYGEGSPEHMAALESLAIVYGHMLRLDGRIIREGREDELCLIGSSNRLLTYAVIFWWPLSARKQSGRKPRRPYEASGAARQLPAASGFPIASAPV
jgi:hypothetical protein